MSDTKRFRTSSVGVTVGTAAVVVLLIGFVASIMLASQYAMGAVGSIDELKSAIRDKTAINCVILSEEDGDFVLQANDGFKKVKVMMYGFEGGEENMLSIKDDGTYYWDDDGNAFKMGDDSAIDELIGEIAAGAEDELDEGYTIKCDAPSKSDFALPSLNFIDAGE